MDRPIIYTGEVPRSADFLGLAKDSLYGLAYLSGATVGTGTAIAGLAIAPTGPASLSFTIGTGSIYIPETVDATAYSTLGTDTHNVIKQGILNDPVTLTITPPATSGFSQVFLVQVGYLDADIISVVPPYFNSVTPGVPFNGAGGAGGSQNTVRQGQLVVQLKAGTAASTGSQVTPSPDAGFTPVWIVTVANGATTITSANWTQHTAAPYFPALSQVPVAVINNQWTFGTATGGPTAYAVTLPLIVTAYSTGMEVLANFTTQNSTTAPTMNVNALGAVAIVKSNGAAVQPGDLMGFLDLIYDGSSFRINGLVASDFQRVITTSTSFFVNNSTGNDTTLDGTSATVSGSHGPWATITKAIKAISTYNLNGNTVTIRLGLTGLNYAMPGSFIPPSNGTLIIQGDVAAQASYVIAGAAPVSNGVFESIGPGPVSLVGATVTNTNANGSCIQAVNGGSISLTNVTLKTSVVGSVSLVSAGVQGQVTFGAGCIMNGAATNMILIQSGGSVVQSANVTVAGTPTFTTAVMNSQSGYFAVSQGGLSWTGSATGPRYSVTLNGVVNTASGGASFFPGSAVGTTATGGQYA